MDTVTNEVSVPKEPHIGIFYVIHGGLRWMGVPASSVPAEQGLKDIETHHKEFWRLITDSRPDLAVFDNLHFPRGRVVYLEKHDSYEIFMDRCLANDPVIDQLKREMNLPREKTVIVRDGQYRCACCRRPQ
jgi:hypothetical protein